MCIDVKTGLGPPIAPPPRSGGVARSEKSRFQNMAVWMVKLCLWAVLWAWMDRHGSWLSIGTGFMVRFDVFGGLF